MKSLFLIGFLAAAHLAIAGEATVQVRILGLFDPPRAEELRQQAAAVADFRFVEVSYDTGVATFAYANDRPPFKNSKPGDVERNLRERLAAATKGAFQARPLSAFPRENWQEVRIALVRLDCRACSFGVCNLIAEIEGVERATASMKDGTLTAWIDPSKTSREALVAALRKRQVNVNEEASKSASNLATKPIR